MKPKILIWDIETSPIEAYVWGLWDNNVALNQIKKDWNIISWSAKWHGEKKVLHMDLRHQKNKSDDKKIVTELRKLIESADVVVTQNGKSFDIKKLNARCILNGLKPIKRVTHLDVCRIAKKTFGFTSHKLEYMTNKLCTKYKKLKVKKFQGQDLWTECLKGNQLAWKEMHKYNDYDVLSLEELYNIIIPWDNSINFNVYNDEPNNKCKCGNNKFVKNGFCYSSIGRYQRYACSKCGAESRDRKNLLSKQKKQSIQIR